MAAGAHLAVRNAVAALYAGLTTVYENRDLALASGVASHIQVYIDQAAPESRELRQLSTTAPIDWTTTIHTVIKARKDGATSAETTADALLTACYARVMADQTLGGLVGLTDAGTITWEQDEADSNVVMVTLDFSFQHRTQAHSIA